MISDNREGQRYVMTRESSLRRIVLPGLVCILAGGLLAGCGHKEVVEKPQIAPGMAGTTSAWARYIDSGFMPVTGYGIVVGLGDNGGTEVPPRLKLMLTKYISAHGIGSHRQGMSGVTPMRFLRDPDTAIVRIVGKIPAGAPAGSKFDIKVEAIGNQTKSLDGGWLYAVDLHQQTAGVDVAVKTSHVLATAEGPVYINPFVDTTDPANDSRLRSGRIVGGGKVT
ncbi:MAG TPA: hypothetical protein ENL03_00615, partial [Phycisphaerae bacterium]|nr:hypothetical protein [Phycisphaerae bacterium]